MKIGGAGGNAGGGVDDPAPAEAAKKPTNAGGTNEIEDLTHLAVEVPDEPAKPPAVPPPVPSKVGGPGLAATSGRMAAVNLADSLARSLDVSGDRARLNPTQRQVLADTEVRAEKNSAAARPALLQRAKDMGYTEAEVDRALEVIGTKATTCVHFDPTKLLKDGKSTVLDAFTKEGVYKNQFETGITGGHPSAIPGGARDNWEKTIFAGGYHKKPLDPAERPRYGALNAEAAPEGTASPYGTSYLVLKPATRERSTYTPLNSSMCGADHVGTPDHLQHVLLNATEDRFKQIMEVTNGKKPVGTPPEHNPAIGWEYMETQVHGPIDFGKDVGEIVAPLSTPPAYAKKLEEFADKFGIDLVWLPDESDIVT